MSYKKNNSKSRRGLVRQIMGLIALIIAMGLLVVTALFSLNTIFYWIAGIVLLISLLLVASPKARENAFISLINS